MDGTPYWRVSGHGAPFAVGWWWECGAAQPKMKIMEKPRPLKIRLLASSCCTSMDLLDRYVAHKPQASCWNGAPRGKARRWHGMGFERGRRGERSAEV